MRSYKSLYRSSLESHPNHPWPDATREAHLRFWEDSAHFLDRKWEERILSGVLPEARRALGKHLNLTRPDDIALAPNTHELVFRLVSALPAWGKRPVRVLTTDSEFHSFSRQLALWEEAGQATAQRVPTEPFASFPERFLQAARSGQYDLIYVSHVFFNSGYVFQELKELALAAPESAEVAIDGYHSFAAIPVQLQEVGERCFYLAGGYKYAQAGEGACFMTLPPRAQALRPKNSGWFAAFGSLSEKREGSEVVFPNDGFRYAGATFDPSGWYRFNAVMRLWEYEGIDVEAIHSRAMTLAKRLIENLEWPGLVKTGHELERQGNFLAYELPRAAQVHARLAEQEILTDFRGNRLRFGFGLYHDVADVDRLCVALRKLDSE
jgi:selenocysteine lyase/cysteine desulfurase